jgi:uncharacterized GH25 family protein
MNFRRTSRQLVRASLVAVLLGGAAAAQEVWLRPERLTATPGATISFDLLGGAEFAQRETLIKPERVKRARAGLAGKTWGLVDIAEADNELRIFATLAQPGVAVAGVELKPERIEVPAEKTEFYLRSIYASAALRAVWEEVAEPRRWRENRTSYVKTFARIGVPPADDQGWGEPLGLALEIVPERDPTTLRMGDELPVKVLREGKPLSGFVLSFVTAEATREHVIVTDAEGRGHTTLDASGAWLVHGVELHRSTASDTEWESARVTMMVEAQ